jgi:MFS family permease
VVQGAGGAIFPLAFGIIRDEFPRERVATSIGLISATFGIGGGGGLVLSGVLVDQVDVSWIFWLGLLGTVIALVATWRWVPESPVRVRARVDVVGAALLSTGLGALLLGVSEGNAWGWGSDRVLALFFGSLLVLVTFVRFELGRSQPLVDMRLMRARPVLTTNLAALAVGFAMFGSYVLIPQLVQTPSRAGYGFDASVTASGVFLLPSAFVMLFSGPLSGQLGARFGSRLPLGLGAVACGIASFGLAAAHADRIDIYLGGAVIGLGIGLAFAAMANLVVEAVSQDQTGVATGINTIMRAIGGALGAQIAAALLAAHSVLGGRYPAESGFTDAFLMSGCGALLALLATWAIPSRFAARAGRLAQIEG